MKRNLGCEMCSDRAAAPVLDRLVEMMSEPGLTSVNWRCSASRGYVLSCIVHVQPPVWRKPSAVTRAVERWTAGLFCYGGVCGTSRSDHEDEFGDLRQPMNHHVSQTRGTMEKPTFF